MASIQIYKWSKIHNKVVKSMMQLRRVDFSIEIKLDLKNG